MPKTDVPTFTFRNVTLADVKEIYQLLVANRPYVGLNSRYTYFLLARDFQETCLVAEWAGKIVGFSSGYVPPRRPDTFFNWEIVVDKDYRGYGLQRQMLLHQIHTAGVKYFEGTINPSNEISKRNYQQIAKLLNTRYHETILFSEADFENDGHEAEFLIRIGPICKNANA